MPTRDEPGGAPSLGNSKANMADDHLPGSRETNADRSHLRASLGADTEAVEANLRARSIQQGLLVQATALLAGATDAEAVLGQVVSLLRQRAQLTTASVYLLDQDDRVLRCVAASGFERKGPPCTFPLDGGGMVAWVARTGEATYVPQVAKAPRYLSGDPSAKSEYASPLRLGSRVLGVLDIASDEADGIRAVMRKLADQFACQVALALERSELQRKLQASEERFRSILEQGEFGVALCDLDGRLATVSPGLARMLGYDPDQLRGMRYIDITHPEDREEARNHFQRLLDGRAARFTLQMRGLRKSGEPLWCLATVSLIREAPGSRPWALALVQDITDRRSFEEERSQHQEQLLHAQKMEAIGTLAGGVAHDFNNVLGVILGFCSLLRLRLSPQDPLRGPIGMIEQSAERAAALASQLLGFARPVRYRVRPTRIEEVVRRVTAIVTETFDRRITIETRLPADLPWIEGDVVQLEQALLNLCINARDSMPQGGTLTLGVRRMALEREEPLLPPHCRAGPYVRICVRDTGAGMGPEVMKRIFEPFFTTKEPGKGTGLGLAVVYDIVKNHDGFVCVTSQLGGGSEFAIYLPAGKQPTEGAEEIEPKPIEQGSGTVLVVDDEPLILAFAQEALQALGYKVLTAEDGSRACEIYRQRAKEIDYVLLDVVLPGMSGIETCQKLREMNPQARVILSSGYGSGGEASQAITTGDVDFIGKPYTVEKLSRVLGRNREKGQRQPL